MGPQQVQMWAQLWRCASFCLSIVIAHRTATRTVSGFVGQGLCVLSAPTECVLGRITVILILWSKAWSHIDCSALRWLGNL